MHIPNSPKEIDPLRHRREYPVDQVRSVKIDDDAKFVIELDCLDDGFNSMFPGFEHQPTRAVIGMSRANAERLLELLNATMKIGVTNEVT